MAQPFTGYQDTVVLPNRTDDGVVSRVTILLPFLRPNLPGRFLYHCHMLEHEDGGMMAVIEVVAPPGAPGASFLSTPLGIAIVAIAAAIAVAALVLAGVVVHRRRRQKQDQQHGNSVGPEGMEPSEPTTPLLTPSVKYL